jgi:radical SAM-linked protein
MKARIKFQKYGSMKFIGHLDVMRYFQKLFRRADIDNEYSKGFSPHQIMSFAAPLGVGLTSDGEYLDVNLLSADAPEVMLERMNAAATDGFRIVGFHPLLDPEENKKIITAMSLVASADYLVSLKDGYSIPDINTQEAFKTSFLKFLEQKEIIIDKKTKTSEKAVDIRPMITLCAFDENEYDQMLKAMIKPENEASDSLSGVKMQNLKIIEMSYRRVEANSSLLKANQLESTADQYENGIKAYLQLHTGSTANLKPELVMEAFCNFLGVPYEEFAWQVHRIELYTRDTSDGKLISLDRLER